ncbi:MAG: hypothetical protein JSV66_04610, partial [Trueperaceae bacterium]
VVRSESMNNAATTNQAAVARVGQRVSFRLGTSDVEATVIEDRGPIGINGRRLVRVRLDADFYGEEHDFEMPVEELHPA